MTQRLCLGFLLFKIHESVLEQKNTTKRTQFEGTSDLFSSQLTGILDCSAMDDSATGASYIKPKKACFSSRGKANDKVGIFFNIVIPFHLCFYWIFCSN